MLQQLWQTLLINLGYGLMNPRIDNWCGLRACSLACLRSCMCVHVWWWGWEEGGGGMQSGGSHRPAGSRPDAPPPQKKTTPPAGATWAACWAAPPWPGCLGLRSASSGCRGGGGATWWTARRCRSSPAPHGGWTDQDRGVQPRPRRCAAPSARSALPWGPWPLSLGCSPAPPSLQLALPTRAPQPKLPAFCFFTVFPSELLLILFV